MLRIGPMLTEQKPVKKPLTEAFILSIAPIVVEISEQGFMLDRMMFMIDFGAGLLENKKHDWSFWLKSGHRMDIAVGLDGGWVFYMTSTPDPDWVSTVD